MAAPEGRDTSHRLTEKGSDGASHHPVPACPDPVGSRRGRLRAGTALIARGEFSVVIIGLAAPGEGRLAALVTTYVMLLAVCGPVLTRFAPTRPPTRPSTRPPARPSTRPPARPSTRPPARPSTRPAAPARPPGPRPPRVRTAGRRAGARAGPGQGDASAPRTTATGQWA
ncbi:hypothetical protein L1856_25755 [Streptomyces sp. Tue 6430]|nr:hypothetical protein [Streptomyces sp. Tue 6430]